jgi:hypothetical protein
MVSRVPIFDRLLGRRSSAVPALPYPPDSPEGLAARWVRWAASIERHRNPVADLTGKFAGLGQPDDVWFLAGTFGTTAHRHCAVPSGRRLFVPIFNMWHRDADGPPPVMGRAFGTLVVNDVAVPVDVVATPVPFGVAGVRGNPVTASTRVVPMTVWGLWKVLEPLSPGDHTLRMRGGDGYGFEVAVDYRLTVA